MIDYAVIQFKLIYNLTKYILRQIVNEKVSFYYWLDKIMHIYLSNLNTYIKKNAIWKFKPNPKSNW